MTRHNSRARDRPPQTIFSIHENGGFGEGRSGKWYGRVMARRLRGEVEEGRRAGKCHDARRDPQPPCPHIFGIPKTWREWKGQASTSSAFDGNREVGVLDCKT
jgi:hypothetical protein